MRVCGALAALALCAAAWGGAHTGRAIEARGRLLVQVHLNGQGPYPFLLDAGLRRPVLDPGVADYLGLPIARDPAVAADGAGAAVHAPVAYVAAFQIAPDLENDETVPLVALDALSARLGQPVAGLLPAYQAGLEVSFQFEPPGVSWRTLDAAALGGPAPDAVPIRIDAHGAPTFDALLDGRSARRLALDLDIGEDLALSPRTLRDLGVGVEDLVEVRYAGGETVRQARIASVKVGGATLAGPVARVAEGPDALGLGFLRHHGVTINFEFGRMLIAAPARAAGRPAPTGYGIVLDGVVDGLWAIGIVTGGPADLAGLWPGDRLLSVDGNRLHGAPAAAAEARLAPEAGDREIALTVLRHGEPVTATLRPAPLFP